MRAKKTEDRKILPVLGCAACVLALVGIVFSMIYFAGRETAVDTVSAGKVCLKIETEESSGEYDGNLTEGLLPGQAVEKRPMIVLEEDSEDAYIRVKIEYGGALSEEEGNSGDEEAGRSLKIQELEEGISFSEDWRKGADGYYYYQKKVCPGETIVLFAQVTIPENWGNEIAEQAFSIDLTAEGILADYFDPWSEDEAGNPVITGWYYTDGAPVLP